MILKKSLSFDKLFFLPWQHLINPIKHQKKYCCNWFITN